jgi:hypothetical protein
MNASFMTRLHDSWGRIRNSYLRSRRHAGAGDREELLAFADAIAHDSEAAVVCRCVIEATGRPDEPSMDRVEITPGIV